LQNFAPSVIVLPQETHCRAGGSSAGTLATAGSAPVITCAFSFTTCAGIPHFLQNFAPSSMALPQKMHCGTHKTPAGAPPVVLCTLLTSIRLSSATRSTDDSIPFIALIVLSIRDIP
jgi:hypothetical protein